MNRQELLEALLVERWSGPVRDDRPAPVPVTVPTTAGGDIAALVEELYPLRLVQTCDYAACHKPADEALDGWVFCRSHAPLHRDEVAS